MFGAEFQLLVSIPWTELKRLFKYLIFHSEHEKAHCKLIYAYVRLCVFPSLYALYYKSLYPKVCQLLVRAIVFLPFPFAQELYYLVFRTRSAPFIYEAEPGRGTRFRGTLLMFALKLWRVSVPACSAASEERSSLLTLQIRRALLSCTSLGERFLNRTAWLACAFCCELSLNFLILKPAWGLVRKSVPWSGPSSAAVWESFANPAEQCDVLSYGLCQV